MKSSNFCQTEFADALVRTIREPLLVLDGALMVLFANTSFYRLFGLPPEGTEGRQLSELADGRWGGPELHALLEGIVRRDSSFEDFEVRGEFPGLGERAFLLNGRRMLSEGRELVLLAFEDATERQAARAALERSNRELEQFASVASHDLQEPLRMVVSFLELLSVEYKGKLDAQAEEYVGFAVDGAKRMQRLIADLLSYARLEGGASPFQAVPLETALADGLAALGAALAETGGAVEHGPLPVVRGERWQLAQLFQNLVGNALKFRGPAAPRLRVDASRRNGTWTITVADNGIGIAPAHFTRIFDLFERLHGAEVPGTGIGLALCRRIVERHGGKIRVESSSPEGTCFAFTLPAAEPPAGEHT